MSTNTTAVADAVLMPRGYARGATLADRIAAILDVAEPLLGVDRAAGGRAHVRRQPNEVLFITRDPHDSLLHPNGSPGSGRPRYRWERREDGIQLGYLKHD